MSVGGSEQEESEMIQGTAIDLVHLSDGENSVIVRVECGTGVIAGQDYLDAEIVVASAFVNGRLELTLLPEDLGTWRGALESLAAGVDASWMDDGRNPEIRIELAGPFVSRGTTLQALQVVVRDVAASLTSANVLVRMPDGWIQDHRERLDRLLQPHS